MYLSLYLIYVDGYGLLYFAKNMCRTMCSEKLIATYHQKLDYGK